MSIVALASKAKLVGSYNTTGTVEEGASVKSQIITDTTSNSIFVVDQLICHWRPTAYKGSDDQGALLKVSAGCSANGDASDGTALLALKLGDKNLAAQLQWCVRSTYSTGGVFVLEEIQSASEQYLSRGVMTKPYFEIACNLAGNSLGAVSIVDYVLFYSIYTLTTEEYYKTKAACEC